jgi:DNA-binding response OmpR family regulator
MRILIVDDSDSVRLTLAAIFEDAGHLVTQAESLAMARECLLGGGFDLVVLDVRLGDDHGPALIPEVRAALPSATIALLSGDPGLEKGADVVLAKGGDPFELLERLERAVARA